MTGWDLQDLDLGIPRKEILDPPLATMIVRFHHKSRDHGVAIRGGCENM